MTPRQQYINLFACAVFVALVMRICGAAPVWYVLPGLCLVLGLLNGVVRKGILWLWQKFSHVLGHVNSMLILCLLYFLVITPYALVFRNKARRNYLLRQPLGNSSFRERNQRVQKEDFEKSW